MKIKKVIAILLTGGFIMGNIGHIPSQSAQPQLEPLQPLPLVLRYDKPAADWENEALPLGNGFLGAMVFGGVGSETILMNEHSLWSGGPGADPAYDGGHTNEASVNHANLQELRQSLQQKAIDFTETNRAFTDTGDTAFLINYPNETARERELIRSLMGDKTHFGSYQMLTYLKIDDPRDVGAQRGYANITGNFDPPNRNESLAMLFDGNAHTKC